MGSHLHLIDHYLKLQSPIHGLDGRVKLVFTLAYILCCSFLPVGAWLSYILLLAILVILMLLADVGISYVIKRSLLSLPFLFAAIPLVFQASETDLFSFSIWDQMITVYQEGFIRFVSIGIKSWLSITAAILLASTTSFSELLQAMRALGIPRLLVSIFGLMWRYLFLIVEEADRLVRARTSRSGRNSITSKRKGGTLSWRAKVTGGMAGSLFIRSLERSEQVYNAMLARGYDGEIRSLEEPSLDNWTRVRLAAAVGILFLLALASSWLSGAL
jgi:cobalt/nickel transport system permease protein